MAEYSMKGVESRRRLAALEALADPKTTRLLEALGTGPGWRCLEVGAGGGSIAAWLAYRVGPDGYVLATDLDTRHIDAHAAPNLEVRCHDITADALAERAYDLVHARALLEHLVAREAALDRMVAALKPGGWLVTESADYVSWVPMTTEPAEHAALFTKASAIMWEYFPMDPFYGRRLDGGLRARGLTEVGVECWVPVVRGGSPAAEIWRAVWAAHREPIVDQGLLTTAEFDGFIALHDDPTFAWMGPVEVQAWGRRPKSEMEIPSA